MESKKMKCLPGFSAAIHIINITELTALENVNVLSIFYNSSNLSYTQYQFVINRVKYSEL
jgi:hypothetical protein